MMQHGQGLGEAIPIKELVAGIVSSGCAIPSGDIEKMLQFRIAAIHKFMLESKERCLVFRTVLPNYSIVVFKKRDVLPDGLAQEIKDLCALHYREESEKAAKLIQSAEQLLNDSDCWFSFSNEYMVVSAMSHENWELFKSNLD